MCETRQDNGTVLNTKGVQLVPRSVTLSKRLGSMSPEKNDFFGYPNVKRLQYADEVDKCKSY